MSHIRFLYANLIALNIFYTCFYSCNCLKNKNVFILFRKYIQSTKNSKLLNYLIMLLYNLCLHNVNFRMDILKDIDIIQNILTNWTQHEIEYT